MLGLVCEANPSACAVAHRPHDMDVVEYVNRLSSGVGERLDGLDRQIFSDSGSEDDGDNDDEDMSTEAGGQVQRGGAEARPGAAQRGEGADSETANSQAPGPAHTDGDVVAPPPLGSQEVVVEDSNGSDNFIVTDKDNDSQNSDGCWSWME